MQNLPDTKDSVANAIKNVLMNKDFFIYTLSLAAACLICGCSEKPALPSGNLPAGEDVPMLFSTSVADTKSGGPVTGDNFTKQSIGIYGEYSSVAGGDGEQVFGLSSATELKYGSLPYETADGTTEGWHYEPLQYWKRNQHYRFRAFYPYRFSDGTLNAGLLDAASNPDQIVLNYSMTPGEVGSWNNYDLLVAFSTRDTGTGTDDVRFASVPMEFVHALSALRFKVTYMEDNNYVGKLTKFWLNGLRTTGWMTYSYAEGDVLSPSLSWRTYNYNGSSDFFIWSGSKGFEYGEGNEANVYADDTDNKGGLIFVVPQTCSSDSSDGSGADVTSVSFMTEKSGDAVNTRDLPNVTWEPGRVYTYTIQLGTSNIIIDVTSKEWEVLESEISIDI